MSLFWTDSVVLCCANVNSANQFWIKAFDCKPVKPPANWDNPLPSDVAIKLPGYDDPTILICDRTEVERAGFERPNGRPIIRELTTEPRA